jgi:hypothetical protein
MSLAFSSSEADEVSASAITLSAVLYTANVNVDGHWTQLPPSSEGFPWTDGPLATTSHTATFSSLSNVAFPIPPTTLAYIDMSS